MVSKQPPSFFLLLASFSLTIGCQQAPTQPVATNNSAIVSIYWSDRDSGRIDGQKFRLNNIDAPETGGVGAAIGGAKCEAERALGYEAKAWAVKFTQGAELTIVKSYGEDRHERLIVDLAVNGEDVGQAGLIAGVYRSWKHDGKKALEARPVWCNLN